MIFRPSSILDWIRDQWFLVLCIALLTFIAFFPKIPLFELIPGYIVRVRLEDLFVVAMNVLFFLQVIRRKATLNTPVTWMLVFYGVVGVVSMLSAVYLIQTVPLVPLHWVKMLLHFLRRLEYFTVLFMFYNAVKTPRHIKTVIFALLIIVIGVSAYGYGQKYLYWPVYSTMNREFSKGMKLVLTEHARVPSTFGGHYDMSAFIMFALTLLLSVFFYVRNPIAKLTFLSVFVMGFWLLILGSSRSSFLSYLLAEGILILLIGIQKKSFVWMFSRGLAVMAFSLIVMVTLGDLSSRFSQLGLVQKANEKLSSLTKPVREQPKDSIAVDPIDKTDQLPIPAQIATTSASPIAGVTPAKNLPPDVYKDIPDLKTVTSTVSGVTVTKVIEVPREFSECTYVYGLSACIRLETLWPRALNGFIRNPLVGSGYSTLTKSTKDEFTEAESTDNDFLRNLGESGLLGVIGFYGPIVIFFITALKLLAHEQRALFYAVIFGLLAGSLGMFFNANYIDVFEASKVAYLYWSMLGVGFAMLHLMANSDSQSTTQLRKAFGDKKSRSRKS